MLFTDPDLQAAYAEAAKSIELEAAASDEVKAVRQRNLLRWLEPSTSTDPEIQAAHLDAMRSIEEEKNASPEVKAVRRRNLLRWLPSK